MIARIAHRMRRNRAKRYALSHGFFWLPCNICGVLMGGHEWNGASVQVKGHPPICAKSGYIAMSTGAGICTACEERWCDEHGLNCTHPPVDVPAHWEAT